MVTPDMTAAAATELTAAGFKVDMRTVQGVGHSIDQEVTHICNLMMMLFIGT